MPQISYSGYEEDFAQKKGHISFPFKDSLAQSLVIPTSLANNY